MGELANRSGIGISTARLLALRLGINCEKYPPSPLFLMMTLGPLLLVLALFERVCVRRAEQFLRPLGQAPLFFYVLHLYALAWPPRLRSGGPGASGRRLSTRLLAGPSGLYGFAMIALYPRL
jgi:hypothetical protein